MRPWSLWWWTPSVVLALAAEFLPPMLRNSHSQISEDYIVRLILLGAAIGYMGLLVAHRLLYRILTMLTKTPEEDHRPGFEVVLLTDIQAPGETICRSTEDARQGNSG